MKELIGKKVQYQRMLDGKTYVGTIIGVNPKTEIVQIEGGWLPTCRYNAKIHDIKIID